MQNMESETVEKPPTVARSPGLQIKLARIERGIKQWELAQRIGIRPDTLAMIENGRRPGSPEQLQKLREALGLPETDDKI